MDIAAGKQGQLLDSGSVYAATGATFQVDCIAGKFEPNGDTACLTCVVGKYAVQGQIICTDCPDGMSVGIGTGLNINLL